MGCLLYTDMTVETLTAETWPDDYWPFTVPQVHLNCAVHDWVDWKQPTKFSSSFKATIPRTTAERLQDLEPCVPKMYQGFMCGPGLKGCATCGLPSGWLCDFPMGDGKTCDAALCKGHRRNVETEIDLCPIHALMALAVAPPNPPTARDAVD